MKGSKQRESQRARCHNTSLSSPTFPRHCFSPCNWKGRSVAGHLSDPGVKKNPVRSDLRGHGFQCIRAIVRKYYFLQMTLKKSLCKDWFNQPLCDQDMKYRDGFLVFASSQSITCRDSFCSPELFKKSISKEFLILSRLDSKQVSASGVITYSALCQTNLVQTPSLTS